MPDPLFGDWYAGDGDPNWQALVAAGPPWHGAIIKATEGAHYDGGAWFQRHWPAIRREAGDRYGVDFFRGCYHYCSYSEPAEQQLDLFLRTVDKAGGFGPGDLIAVDVERGGQRGGLTAANVIDTTTHIARGVHDATGIPVVLYGGELIRSLGIRDHMGCSFVWPARYSATLPQESYENMGWTAAELLMWQYCGVEGVGKVASFLPRYPTTTPAGFADISVLTLPGGIERVREVFCVTP